MTQRADTLRNLKSGEMSELAATSALIAIG